MGMLPSAATVRKRVRATVSAIGTHIMDFRMLNVECSMLNVEWKRWLVIGLAVFHSTFNIQHSTFAAEQAQFKPALPGYEFAFPRDHGSHDDYKIEWWYYTGHLDTDAGKRY